MVATMKRTLLLSLALLSLAVTSQAAMRITDVLPASVPVTGGTRVQLNYTDFDNRGCNGTTCLWLATIDGQQVPLSPGQTTLTIITAPHARGAAEVKITNPHGEVATATLYFATAEDFERVLLPIVIDSTATPVTGAFGSRWATEQWAANTTSQPADLYLTQPNGILLVPPALFVHLPADSIALFNAYTPSNGAGTVARIPRWLGPNAIAFNSRVRDLSRASDTFGTELPVVHESDFRQRTTLLNVPVGPNARTLLRVYSLTEKPALATVRLRNALGQTFSQQIVSVSAADFAHDASGYAVIELTAAEQRFAVDVISDGTPMWAMATVTNNSTQQVTVVSPQ